MSLNEEKLKCPHCRLRIFYEAHDESFWLKDDQVTQAEEVEGGISQTHGSYGVSYGHCPSCDNLIIFYVEGVSITEISRKNKEPLQYYDWEIRKLIYPPAKASEIGEEVPERYRNDFEEATEVLPISPKASAALSRRILQDVLREELGIAKATLVMEIEAFIQRSDVPTYLTDAVDAIRNIGNFATHPLKNTNTGEVAEVEPGEAEWLLEVNESLFDFVFVQPKKLAERKSKLNLKLKDIGKPSMKTRT